MAFASMDGAWLGSVYIAISKGNMNSDAQLLLLPKRLGVPTANMPGEPHHGPSTSITQ
jgi:hypothetical protein